jgi:hypothetical protein
MKIFRAVLLVTLLAGLAFTTQPTIHTEARADDVISCQEYASLFSGWRPVFVGVPFGISGPFEPGIYTLTVTGAEGMNATVRLVADSLGLTTLDGPASIPVTFTYFMPDVGAQPPGLGLVVDAVSGNFEVAQLHVSIGCVAVGCAALVSIPSQAVVGAFTQNAEIYWAPGELAAGEPNIEAGNTYWVAGQDETGMYRKVLIACQWVWVRAETVGPNYDEVWNGTPLPTDVVE